jgi:hypothetical protein
VQQAWASTIATAAKRSNGMLWYVRRRNLDYRSDVVGRGVRVATDDRTEEKELFDKLKQLGWYDEFNKIIDDLSTTPAAAELVSFFASPKMRDSVLMLGIAFREVAQLVKEHQDVPPLALVDVVQIAERYGEPAMGDGLRQIEPAVLQNVTGDLQAVLWETAKAKVAPDMDRIGDRLVGDEVAIVSFAKGLIERVNDKAKFPKTTEAIQEFVSTTLGEAQR